MPVFSALAFVGYVGLVILVIWSIVAALNRIARTVEEIALTLRRIEHSGIRPNDSTS